MTLELPEDSPMLSMPWIITFGPMADDEEWEPVVCGPYERDHALGLAEEIVADEELTAVVEPLLPLIEVERIREEIAVARALAEEETDEDQDTDIELESEDYDEDEDEDDEEYDEDEESADEDEDGDDEDDDLEYDDEDEHEHPGPPSPDEIRAGFARIAARLTGG